MTSARPNILLLMTDQQRFDSLSCYGCKAIETPNLDKLADQGVLFENCYSPNPICTPSRASMLTGKTLPGHGVYKLHDILPDDQVLFSKRLQETGYETTLVGKLHVSGYVHEEQYRHPNDGFDNYYWCHDPGLSLDSEYNAYAKWVKEKDPVFFEDLKRKGRSMRHFPADLHFTRWASETTVNQIESSDPDKPFFIFMSLFDPHNPYFDYPEEFADKVDTDKLSSPLKANPEKNIPSGVQREIDKCNVSRCSSEYRKKVEEDQKGYYASIAFLDNEIGKVLDCLEAKGIADETLVIFVSDHGDMLYDKDLTTKGGFFYDPSVRVPFIMRYPQKLSTGRKVNDLVQQIDVAATVLSAAGIEYSDDMPEAMNLIDLVEKGKDCKGYRDYAVCSYCNTGYGPNNLYFNPELHGTMFRDERYKLNVYHSLNVDGETDGELFDILSDPHEENNLWEESSHQGVKFKLMQRLNDWVFVNSTRYLGSRGGEKFGDSGNDYLKEDKGI